MLVVIGTAVPLPIWEALGSAAARFVLAPSNSEREMQAPLRAFEAQAFALEIKVENP